MYSNVNAPFMGANVNAPFMGANVNAPFMGENIPFAEPQYVSPVMGYGYGAPARGFDGFTLIVVLFILLIIVGAGAFAVAPTTKC